MNWLLLVLVVIAVVAFVVLKRRNAPAIDPAL
jgi:hypothetical protein